MDIYKAKLVEDKLQGIIDKKISGEDNGKSSKPQIDQFFPNIDLRKLDLLVKRIAQEKNITAEDLDKYTRKYIRQNNKLLTDMREDDLIEIVALLLKDRDQQEQPPSTYYSPFEVYAQNYLQIIAKHQEEMLNPAEIYADTNKMDKEIFENNEKIRETNRDEQRRSLHKKLANMELEVKNNFTSLEELKKTKAKMIEAGFAI